VRERGGGGERSGPTVVWPGLEGLCVWGGRRGRGVGGEREAAW